MVAGSLDTTTPQAESLWASVDGQITTVINNVKPNYISNLQAATPDIGAADAGAAGEGDVAEGGEGAMGELEGAGEGALNVAEDLLEGL